MRRSIVQMVITAACHRQTRASIREWYKNAMRRRLQLGEARGGDLFRDDGFEVLDERTELAGGLLWDLIQARGFEHVHEHRQELVNVIEDELRLGAEQAENGSEYRLVLERVVTEGKGGEENREDLVKGHGSLVLADHASDSTGSVILGVRASGRGVLGDVEKRLQGRKKRQELGRQVGLGVLHEDTGGKGGIAAHIGLWVLQTARDELEEVGGELGHTALHADDDLTERSDSHGALGIALLGSSVVRDQWEDRAEGLGKVGAKDGGERAEDVGSV